MRKLRLTLTTMTLVAIFAVLTAGTIWALPIREFPFTYSSSLELYTNGTNSMDHFDFYSTIYPGRNISSGQNVELDYSFTLTQGYGIDSNTHLY
jgi:hypothetical protein